MQLPLLAKDTEATVHLEHALDMDGGVRVLCVIKQRFGVDLDGAVKREPGAEVKLSDELWDEEKPEGSSLKYASDLCLRKPATDVVVKAEAMSPGKQPQRELDVLVRVGGVERALRVFGARVWYKGLTGLAFTPPEPFEAMPLKWELSFGGRDTSTGTLLEEPRNPVGAGFVADTSALVHQPLPNVEDPRALIKNEKSRPKPAGVAPIMHHWAPRKDYAGTHDDYWLRERLPLSPLDFDARHNQIAPSELIYPGYLRGGEQVDLYNLCEAGALRFTLPKLSFFVGAQVESGLVSQPVVLDTLILEPNEQRFEMVWRSSVPVPARMHELYGVQVNEREVLR
jgi:hypothetical protein